MDLIFIAGRNAPYSNAAADGHKPVKMQSGVKKVRYFFMCDFCKKFQFETWTYSIYEDTSTISAYGGSGKVKRQFNYCPVCGEKRETILEQQKDAEKQRRKADRLHRLEMKARHEQYRASLVLKNGLKVQG